MLFEVKTSIDYFNSWSVTAKERISEESMSKKS